VATRACTEFEMKVYDACRKIPKGKVATYSSLAKAINAPKAVRAVGTALKKNPYAPEVPCHRVIASDLSLGNLQFRRSVHYIFSYKSLICRWIPRQQG
jgi:methylated-DNA-[protein]-cysteine S-methyltransferase